MSEVTLDLDPHAWKRVSRGSRDARDVSDAGGEGWGGEVSACGWGGKRGRRVSADLRVRAGAGDLRWEVCEEGCGSAAGITLGRRRWREGESNNVGDEPDGVSLPGVEDGSVPFWVCERCGVGAEGGMDVVCLALCVTAVTER